MISAVNSCNPVIQTKPIQFKGEQIQTEPTKKEGMSTTTKALLGLGALAAVTVGGLLLHKNIKAKNVEDVATKAKRMLEKPDDFSEDMFNDVLKTWKNSGKLNPEAGDKVVLIKKSGLLKEGWSEHCNELHKAMNLSDNAFALCVKREGSGKVNLRYFDPKIITSESVNKAIKSNYDILPVNL